MDSADIGDTGRNKAWFCVKENVSYTGDEHKKGVDDSQGSGTSDRMLIGME